MKILTLILWSSVKFLAAAPLALAYGFNYYQTLIITMTGGILGVFFFFYIGEHLGPLLNIIRIRYAMFRGQNMVDIKQTKRKKIFTWRSRLMVRTIRRFGLIGIAALTPIILSIPVGTILAARYYHNKKQVLAYLCISVLCWSVIMSTLVVIF